MPFAARDITYCYDDHRVIDGISMTLAPGKFYGIIGPNGCGKTTVLDLLCKHRRPASGSITYNGKDLHRFSSKALAREIAVVPQNFYINFPFRTREVVMMGRYPFIARFSPPSAEDTRIVEDAMHKTGTDEFENRFITELSGGERQRVVFARSLAQNTPVLILDEATSNLDVSHSLGLLDVVARQVKQDGKTVVAVFQDINLAAMYCEDLLFMKQGRVVVHGPIAEVLNPDTMRMVFNVEAKIYFERYSGTKQVVFKRQA